MMTKEKVLELKSKPVEEQIHFILSDLGDGETFNLSKEEIGYYLEFKDILSFIRKANQEVKKDQSEVNTEDPLYNMVYKIYYDWFYKS